MKTISLILVISFFVSCAPVLKSSSSNTSSSYQDSDNTNTSENTNDGSGSPNDKAGSVVTYNDQAPALLIINEFYYDDAQSDTDGYLFIELYGTPGAGLSGYAVRFINGADGLKTDDVVLDETAVIPDDGYFVIADSKTGSDSETHVENADYISNFDPQNGPDAVQLIEPSGAVVDVLGYGPELASTDSEGLVLYEGSPSMLVEKGSSLSRVLQADTDNNAADFIINLSPSPGTGEVTPMDDPSEVDTESVVSTEADALLTESESSVSDVHFTEVVTDPQQDWNDSTDGDGIAFNSIPGSGTVGSTDEWIEIKNSRDVSVDLTGWSLAMNDGTDVTDAFSSSTSLFIFSDGGSLTDFQSGESLVIGNPPGDMKNTITLALYDSSNDLVDELNIDDSNADDPSNESYQLLDDDSWTMGEASPGF